VAERNYRNESKRVKPTLIRAVFPDALLERFEIGEEVAMCEDDSAGIAGCAGGEENFCEVAPCSLISRIAGCASGKLGRLYNGSGIVIDDGGWGGGKLRLGGTPED